MPVFEIQLDDARCAVTLSYSTFSEKEGELSLNLFLNGTQIFLLFFTIAPGWVVKSDAAEAILISCISANRQTSFTKERLALYRDAYDDFFAVLGLERNSENLFIGPIPLPEKPLAAVKRGHKIRTKQKH